MEKVCPVCNEIASKIVYCEKCGDIMNDKGRMQEYMDDYSADMPIKDEKKYCIHIYKCDNCDYIKRVYIEKVNI
ncbi:hypothetical protein ACFIJ5_04965 [Haloimpatiens sp. FM7330]|uniref:hypothetical protein n=1 Tax=Haloimpatiens sp. FM7330 TaxID=3298610 RepID=UPI0036318342